MANDTDTEPQVSRLQTEFEKLAEVFATAGYQTEAIADPGDNSGFGVLNVTNEDGHYLYTVTITRTEGYDWPA
jgi:hypothetical protein